MSNIDIRDAANKAGVKLWQIAEGLGYADSTFSRKLRHELPQPMKAKIFTIIERLTNESEDW